MRVAAISELGATIVLYRRALIIRMLILCQNGRQATRHPNVDAVVVANAATTIFPDRNFHSPAVGECAGLEADDDLGVDQARCPADAAAAAARNIDGPS